MGGTILYSTATIAAQAAAGTRLQRSVQSSAAEELMSRLTSKMAITARSKSHSRTMIAVAAGDAPDLRLGIDIEWKKPDRPFDAIAGLFVDVAGRTIGIDAFYRAWTFGEAYFKAFQRQAGAAELDQILDLPADSAGPIALGADGIWTWQRPLGDAFQMSLVWRTAGNEPCDLRHVTLA
jgi:hypothetical protein